MGRNALVFFFFLPGAWRFCTVLVTLSTTNHRMYFPVIIAPPTLIPETN